jgi:hypothetical protein
MIDEVNEDEPTPIWYNKAGTIVFEPFRPQLATVFGTQCALILIRCQACGTEFQVADDNLRSYRRTWNLKDAFAHGTWDYGDAPETADCCPVGYSMTTEPVRLLEFWEREIGKDWVKQELPPFVVPDWCKSVAIKNGRPEDENE